MTTFAAHFRSALIAVAAGALPAAVGIVRADTIATVAPATAETPFTREALLGSLARALTAQFNLEGDLQIDLIRPWTPPAKVATVWDLQVLEFPTTPSSSMMLRCRLLADAAPAAEATFVVRAQLWRDAWSTRAPLSAGTIFDPGALETRRVDLFRERDALPAAVGDRSFVLARAVPAGRMLTWRDISRRPLVKKGDLVEVAAVEGPLVVTMKGMAMENGAQGDSVTVRNPVTRKDFVALVVSENRVQVRF